MNKLALLAIVLSTSGCFNGCQKKKEAEAIEPSPPISAEPEGSSAAKPLTGEELAQHAIACWGYFNDDKWDDFKGCYAPNIVYESPAAAVLGVKPATTPDAVVAANKASKLGTPDLKGDVRLTLVHDHDVVVVAANSATHTGPLEGVTAMNQKLADLVANVDVMDDQGRETRESDYEDNATVKYQLTPDKAHPVRGAAADVPKATVVAKNDDAEKANVAVVQSLIDAFDKHDAKAMGNALADNVVWSEQENPKDWTKAEALADARNNWKAFSDMKMTPTALWAAGDYVVLQANMEGTNDAAAPEMGLKTATKKKVTLPFFEVDEIKDGKIAKAWVIADSSLVSIELGLVPMPATPASGSAGSATGSATK